jgi:hypothetical protein
MNSLFERPSQGEHLQEVHRDLVLATLHIKPQPQGKPQLIFFG